MDTSILTKEGLLGVAIFLIPFGTNLVLADNTLIAGLACLVLGVGCVGFRAWLKAKYAEKKEVEAISSAVSAVDAINE
jgi:hypothetical protein